MRLVRPAGYHAKVDEVWEVEQLDDTLHIRAGSKPVDVRTFASEDEARYAMGKLVQKRRTSGFEIVVEAAGSTIALEEYFATGDDRFLSELYRIDKARYLAELAARWHADPRPWARAQLHAYVDDGCDRPFHKGLVKRMFKLAEHAADDATMIHFLVAFDRLARRVRIGSAILNDSGIPAYLAAFWRDRTPMFTRSTRRYLARRAYRYFRRIGYRDPARYGALMRIALPRYRDAALASAAQFLDAWGLVHVLYGRSPALEDRPRGLVLADKATLADLVPAPQFPAAWDGVFDELLAMLFAARSRTVRVWTVALLGERYRAQLEAQPFATVKRMLLSGHDDLEQFGAARLATLPGLGALPIDEWIALLAIENLEVVPVVVAAVEQHVAPVRLSLAQCVALAGAKIAQVAALGLRWARDKPVVTADDLATIATLARAGVASVRAEGAAWACATIAAHPLATAIHLRDLCDAPAPDARAPALAAVVATGRFASDPALWLALAESPYPDVRIVVGAQLARWEASASPGTLQHLWRSAILAIHTGGRAKRDVPRAIANRIATHRDEARALLPILGLAMRSVRPAERAPALVALVTTLSGDPDLAALARELLPELVVGARVSA